MLRVEYGLQSSVDRDGECSLEWNTEQEEEGIEDGVLILGCRECSAERWWWSVKHWGRRTEGRSTWRMRGGAGTVNHGARRMERLSWTWAWSVENKW